MEGFFDQVIVINLDQSTDRWRSIQDGLQKMGVLSHVTRLAATDRGMADQLLGHVNPRWKMPQVHPDQQVNLAHLARKISHWRALCLAKKKQWKRVLIMEDDVVITESGIDRLNQGLDQASSALLQWDLLWVYGNDPQFPKIFSGQTHQSGLVRPVDHCFGTSCYGVDSGCLDQVIEAVENPAYGDLDLARLFAQHVHPHMKTFIMWPCPLTPNPDLPSTISVAAEHTADTVDSAIIKLLMEEIRRRVRDPSSYPVSVMTYWKTRVRPHFLYGSPRATVENHRLIWDTLTEMLEWMEANLDPDQNLLVDFVAGLADVDGLDCIPKCLDVLHVTAFYQGNFGLSVRSASLLEKRLEKEAVLAPALDRLRENAVFAREDLAVAIKEMNIKGCGFDGAYVITRADDSSRWIDFQKRWSLSWPLKPFQTPKLHPVLGNCMFEISHVLLWRKMLAWLVAKADSFLVMQDDAQFSDQFHTGQWLKAYQQLNRDHPEWDVCFLCHALKSTAGIVDSVESDGYHVGPVDPVDPGGDAVDSLSAYWINRRGASKMIRFLDGDSGKTEPLHHQLIRHTRAFAVCPSPCRIK